jgi:hypothetical protein
LFNLGNLLKKGGDPGYNKYTEEKKIEDFFYKTIRGIKLRKEIDELKGI